MPILTTTWVYEVKDRDSMIKLDKSLVSKEMRKRCNEVARKYPVRTYGDK